MTAAGALRSQYSLAVEGNSLRDLRLHVACPCPPFLIWIIRAINDRASKHAPLHDTLLRGTRLCHRCLYPSPPRAAPGSTRIRQAPGRIDRVGDQAIVPAFGATQALPSDVPKW